jgi:hypothetical protein
MAHVSLIEALAMMAVLVSACSGSEKSRSEETGRAADSAKPTATASTQRRVSMVMIGKGARSGNRISEPTFQFAPQDTVYVSVATEGSTGPDTLTAAWRSQDGKILKQSSQPVAAAGENAAFSLSLPKGFKPGTYKVVLFLGDDSVDTKMFAVKK